VLLVAVADGLLEPVEGLVRDLDGGEPLDAGHAVPAGNDQAQREAVLRWQGLPVHLVGEQDFRAGRLGDGQAAGVRLVLPALQPAVGAAGNDLDRLGKQTGLVEQRSK